jgi:hypothetical protein
MDQTEGGRKEQMKAESVKAFGADAGPTAAGRGHPIRIAARASADAGMGVSENRTDGMRRDVARTGAVWPAESCLLLARFISPFPGGAIEAIEAFLGHILPVGRRHGRLNNRDHVPFVPFLSPLLARV